VHTLVADPETPISASAHERRTWSELQARERPDEKRLMGRYCAAHDFLVRPGRNPETDPREKLASILVNNGTTPEMALKECLEWILHNHDTRGPFDLTWYTTGTLVPSTLKTYRDEHPQMALATHLFLFPGRVDQQIEAVSGPDPVDFAERMTRCFRYAFLSAHSFDMATGTAYFHLPEEVRLQKALATRHAAHKFFFLDSGKFRREGEIGYQIADALEDGETATIYTVSAGPERDAQLKQQFQKLCDATFTSPETESANVDTSLRRSLRLVVVGREGTPTDRSSAKVGLLRRRPRTTGEKQARKV
jgi:hypothetical protein